MTIVNYARTLPQADVGIVVDSSATLAPTTVRDVGTSSVEQIDGRMVIGVIGYSDRWNQDRWKLFARVDSSRRVCMTGQTEAEDVALRNTFLAYVE